MLGSFGLGGADPNFGPSLNDIEERRNPNYSAGLRLSMPFTNKRARNDHQAAKLRNEQLLLRYKQLEQSAMVEIENAIRSADAALQRVQATEASMEYSEAALQAEEKKLENGKSTSFVVLQRQRDYTSAQSEVIRSKSDYNKALARLAQAEGFTLEKYQVRLELK
jgi:outer membrane protein TolC